MHVCEWPYCCNPEPPPRGGRVSYVYLMTDDDGELLFVNADDMYTALSKWRTKTGLDEPEKIECLYAEIIP